MDEHRDCMSTNIYTRMVSNCTVKNTEVQYGAGDLHTIRHTLCAMTNEGGMKTDRELGQEHAAQIA